MTERASLTGARIRRIDSPSADLFAFTLGSSSYKGVLIVSLRRGGSGIGLLSSRPQGRAASAFTLKLRKEIEGARVDALQRLTPDTFELRVTREGSEKRLLLWLGDHPDITLSAADGSSIARLHGQDDDVPDAKTTSHPRALPWADTIEGLEELGAALLQSLGSSLLAASREALMRGLRAADKRVERKRQAIAGEAARTELSPKLRADATLLLSSLAQIKRGARSVAVLDYTLDPPAHVELALDPSLDARAQAEAWFARAKRFDRGARIAQQRLELAAEETRALAELREELARANSYEEVEAIAARARRFGVRLQENESGAPTTRAQPKTRVPYRTFRGDRERSILVGRGAADNDELTLKHARPQDLWLHARDVTGAHVVVPLERNEACPPELLRDAALLAAHFSDSRGQHAVDVTYVSRRYVRKPRGAAKGSVNVEREKVFRLQLDAARLQQLLATELPNA